MKKKTLGVLGGVGPLATAYFMEVVINRTKARTDQEHVEMLLINHASIPDRTDYILDHTKPNPAVFMREDARRLESWGAGVLATPCNTAHYFYDELAGAVNIPFVNMIGETAAELVRLSAERVGILATDGTIAAELFQRALLGKGIKPMVPSPEKQRLVMEIIYDDVKAGRPLEVAKFKSVTDELRLEGCDRLILGCTELSVLKKEYSLGDYYVDALEVLADRSIEACGYEVRRD